MFTSLHITRKAATMAALLAVSTSMLASSAALADTAASSASSPAVHVAPAAPPKKAKRQGKRPKLGKAKADSAVVIVGDTQVSYSSLVGCFGPYKASWGWYRTCVWDGFTFGGALLQREYHYQYFDGATYRPWYTVACDNWTCWRI
jgi:hypothetical protein